METKEQQFLINDFREWNELGQLELAPKFQRRKVWLLMAKSYLIDTILRGSPIPKIYIRQKLDLEKSSKTIREVVDGQQRITSLILILSILAHVNCSEEIKAYNNNLIMPNGKFVIQEENYLTEELKHNLGIQNNFNTQGPNANVSKTVDVVFNACKLFI